MRYTTIIDIREFPTVWRSDSCRNLYLYMCLAAGFEDYNRDEVRESIRQLSSHSGLTVGATRHALKQLAKARLVIKRDKVWKVAKWLQAPTISPRELNKRMSKRQQAELAAAKEREEQERRREEEYRERKKSAVSYEEYLAIKNNKN